MTKPPWFSEVLSSSQQAKNYENPACQGSGVLKDCDSKDYYS
jgi:hypothetical protein